MNGETRRTDPTSSASRTRGWIWKRTNGMKRPVGLLGSALAAFPRLSRASGAGHEVAAGAAATSALWTFPSVIFSSLVISWGAEAAQFFMSQGAALAILAWLQTLPEYAVEFVIAKSAATDATREHFIIANFTGSLRLLVGLGWPLVYFTALFFARRHGKPFDGVRLHREHAIEVMCLGVGVVYWYYIWWRRQLTVWDGLVLFVVYASYLWSLRKVPPQQAEAIEEADPIPRWICKQPRAARNTWILLCFAGGGLILFFAATPFLESMLALAVSLGVSQFVFIQWLSPFLSEFPEKLSAFNWARRVSTAPVAVMNMVSSIFNQWTVLAGTLPMVFSAYSGRMRPIAFDEFQSSEILLTLAQSTLAMVLLFNMHFSTREAVGLVVFWLVQFLWPETRHTMIYVYFGWAALEVVLAVISRRGFPAFAAARRAFRGDFA